MFISALCHRAFLAVSMLLLPSSWTRRRLHGWETFRMWRHGFLTAMSLPLMMMGYTRGQMLRRRPRMMTPRSTNYCRTNIYRAFFKTPRLGPPRRSANGLIWSTHPRKCRTFTSSCHRWLTSTHLSSIRSRSRLYTIWNGTIRYLLQLTHRPVKQLSQSML